MTETSTITLNVDSRELDKGNQALDQFQKKATEANRKADELNKTFRICTNVQKQNTAALISLVQGLQNLSTKVSPINQQISEMERKRRQQVRDNLKLTANDIGKTAELWKEYWDVVLGNDNNQAAPKDNTTPRVFRAGYSGVKPADKNGAKPEIDKSDWKGGMMSGAKKGWTEFAESAKNVYGQMETLSKNAFSSMGKALTEYITTGKANFNDFLMTFLKGTLKMISQLLLVKAIESSFKAMSGSDIGWVASVGNFFTGHSNGGYTGNGGKYEPKGIVHGGEFVFTKEATSAIGVGNLYSIMHNAQGYAGGGYVGRAMASEGRSSTNGVNIQTSVVVQNGSAQEPSPGNDEVLTRAWQQTIDQSVRSGVAKELRPGGLIWNATRSR